MSATAQTDRLLRRHRHLGNIVLHSVLIPPLTQVDASTIQVTLAGEPVLILAVYRSPSRPLIGTDLTAYFDAGLPGLMPRNLNAKHVDWQYEYLDIVLEFLTDTKKNCKN